MAAPAMPGLYSKGHRGDLIEVKAGALGQAHDLAQHDHRGAAQLVCLYLLGQAGKRRDQLSLRGATHILYDGHRQAGRKTRSHQRAGQLVYMTHAHVAHHGQATGCQRFPTRLAAVCGVSGH